MKRTKTMPGDMPNDVWFEIYPYIHWTKLLQLRRLSKYHIDLIEKIMYKQLIELLEMNVPKLCVGSRTRNQNKAKNCPCLHGRKGCICYPHYFIPLFSNLDDKKCRWNILNKSKLDLCRRNVSGCRVLQRPTLYSTTEPQYSVITGNILGNKKVKKRYNSNPKWLTNKFLRTIKCKYNPNTRLIDFEDEYYIKNNIIKTFVRMLIEEMRRYLENYTQLKRYIYWIMRELDGDREDLFQYIFSEMMKNIQESEKIHVLRFYEKKSYFKRLLSSDDRLIKIKQDLDILKDVCKNKNV